MSMAFCNLKNKRNPDDSITLINERKASYKFSGVYTTYSFHLRRQNTGKIDLFFFFNFGGLLRWFFSCIDYKVLYTFHKVGGHLSSSPLFETFEKDGNQNGNSNLECRFDVKKIDYVVYLIT